MEQRTRHLVDDVDVDARTGICVVCGPVKVKYKSNRNYYECKTVTDRHKRSWSGNKPETRRQWRLRHHYGLTLDQYNEMYESANGACEICREPLPQLQVDHHHESGEVRGLLCPPCNKGLGQFKDSLGVLSSAVEYLARGKSA